MSLLEKKYLVISMAGKPTFKNVFRFFSTKTDVAKHNSVTEKHMKSASHKTHTLVYSLHGSSFPFHGLQHMKEKLRK